MVLTENPMVLTENPLVHTENPMVLNENHVVLNIYPMSTLDIKPVEKQSFPSILKFQLLRSLKSDKIKNYLGRTKYMTFSIFNNFTSHKLCDYKLQQSLT